MSPDKTKTYMQMALRLAKKGMGITSPNPMVGAVVIREGRIIAAPTGPFSRLDERSAVDDVRRAGDEAGRG